MLTRFAAFAFISLAAVMAAAQPAPTSAPADPSARHIPPAAQREGGSMSSTRPAADNLSVSEHLIQLHGQPLKYRATAGTIVLKDEAEKPKASFFFVAYERMTDQPTDPATRPITFVFNGGPGAAAVWLHLGTAGPKRVSLRDDGDPGPPPHKLIDNDQTWLDFTDLVFIDPVGTGFSRPAPGEKGEQFYGVQEDIRSVGDFIRLYTTRYQRWPSPKFLAGESYGTTRAAGLSQFLLDRYGMAMNGIVLISSVLDFQTISQSDSNDLGYVTYLPSYTAAAWYHKKLAPDLQADLGKTLKEVETFAQTDYVRSLEKGDSLDPETRAFIIQRLTRYTGLPQEAIDRGSLRIGAGYFEKTLLQDQRKLIGRFDARVTGFAIKPLRSSPDYDPSLAQYLAAYTSTFNEYIRRDLNFSSDLPYEVLTGLDWNSGRSELFGGYLNVADDMRLAMAKNPAMKVLFASGYFDLATPYLAATHTIDHMDLDATLRANITHTYYEGGHMLYHVKPALVKLHSDLATFVQSAVAPAPAPPAPAPVPAK